MFSLAGVFRMVEMDFGNSFEKIIRILLASALFTTACGIDGFESLEKPKSSRKPYFELCLYLMWSR